MEKYDETASATLAPPELLDIRRRIDNVLRSAPGHFQNQAQIFPARQEAAQARMCMRMNEMCGIVHKAWNCQRPSTRLIRP